MLLEEDGNYIHMKCGVALICNKWVVTSGLDFYLNQGSIDSSAYPNLVSNFDPTRCRTEIRRLCT